MDTVIIVKCAYCGSSIERHWNDLPKTLRDFCNMDCMNAFRSVGLHSIDADAEITRQLGTSVNFQDTPPGRCIKVGRFSCLQCQRSKCVLDKRQSILLIKN